MNQTYESLLTGDYLAGLIEGDGMINEKQIIIIFSISHLAAAKQIAQKFGGTVNKSYKSRSWRVVFSNLKSITQSALDARLYIQGQKLLNQQIKPYFDAFPPLARRFEFGLWCRALELVNQKAHLTPCGLNKLKTIKTQLTRVKKICLE